MLLACDQSDENFQKELLGKKQKQKQKQSTNRTQERKKIGIRGNRLTYGPDALILHIG